MEENAEKNEIFEFVNPFRKSNFYNFIEKSDISEDPPPPPVPPPPPAPPSPPPPPLQQTISIKPNYLNLNEEDLQNSVFFNTPKEFISFLPNTSFIVHSASSSHIPWMSENPKVEVYSTASSTPSSTKIHRNGIPISFGFGGQFVCGHPTTTSSSKTSNNTSTSCSIYSVSSLILKNPKNEYNSLKRCPGPLGAYELNTTNLIASHLQEKLNDEEHSNGVIHQNKLNNLYQFLYNFFRDVENIKLEEELLIEVSMKMMEMYCDEFLLYHGDAVDAKIWFCILICGGKIEEAIKMGIDNKLWSYVLLITILIDTQKQNLHSVVEMCCHQLFGLQKYFNTSSTNVGNTVEEEARGEILIPVNIVGVLLQLLNGSTVDVTEEICSVWWMYISVCLMYIPMNDKPFIQFLYQLGDALNEKNDVHASHICYLLAGESLEEANTPNSRITLLGVRYHPPSAISIPSFINAFQLSEILEYYHRRRDSEWLYPSLSPFKITYALLLCEFNLFEKAERYLRMSDAFIRTKPSSYYSEVLHMQLRDAVERAANRMQCSGDAAGSREKMTTERKLLSSHLFTEDASVQSHPKDKEVSSIGWLSDMLVGTLRKAL